MKVPSSARRSARIPSLPSLLLGLLAALLLLTLILPQINPGSWLARPGRWCWDLLTNP